MRNVGAIHDAEDGGLRNNSPNNTSYVLRQEDGNDSPVLFHSFQ